MKKTNKHKDFKIPEEYFDSFTSKLLNKITEEETINIPKDNGFKTPVDYFTKVDSSILKKIADAEKTKVITLKPHKKYYYAAIGIAACVLILINLQLNKTTDITFDVVTNSEIETYFDINDVGLTSYEIAEVLPVHELDMNDILSKDLKEENILDYLDNNMEDYEELNLQYNEY